MQCSTPASTAGINSFSHGLLYRHINAPCSGFYDIKVKETKQHCLNLSSYNYLGFAAADAYCTPRVQATTQELGVSSCSSRSDAGEYP